MSEEIWEKINQFLMELRCENTNRSSQCVTKEVQLAKAEQTKRRQSFEIYLEKIRGNDQEVIKNYVESLERLGFAQCQQSYLQGYIDCMLLLSGAGVLTPEKQIEEMIKRIKE